mmetsp:Transcript_9402/g.25503  ORF Transcript_9402/g.25503 Transcript_9402/m.25503 type:complete len:409 (+) Transcript_9402:1084-2310(+)
MQLAMEEWKSFALAGHTDLVRVALFAPSGDYLATASRDKSVRVWRTHGWATGKDWDDETERSMFRHHHSTIYCSAGVTSCDWDPRMDNFLLIGTSDHCIRLYDTSTKRVGFEVIGEDSLPIVDVVRFAPRGETFSAAFSQFHARSDQNLSEDMSSLYNLRLGALSGPAQRSSMIEPLRVASGRWRPLPIDGAKHSKLAVFNSRTGKHLKNFDIDCTQEGSVISCICYNHNGTLLAAGSSDGMLRVFDTTSYEAIMGWPAHAGEVGGVVFGHDETSIFSIGQDGVLAEWSLHSLGRCAAALRLPLTAQGTSPLTFCSLPDLAAFAVAGNSDTGAIVVTTPHRGSISATVTAPLVDVPIAEAAMGIGQTVHRNVATAVGVDSTLHGGRFPIVVGGSDGQVSVSILDPACN